MMSRVLLTTAVMLLLVLTTRGATALRIGDAARPSLAELADAIETRPGERRGNIRRHWGVPFTVAPHLQPYPYGNLRSRERRCSYVWDSRTYRHVLACW